MPKPEQPNCTLCGLPMPEGEEMFNYHGHSGPCPVPPATIVDNTKVSHRALALLVLAAAAVAGGLVLLRSVLA